MRGGMKTPHRMGAAFALVCLCVATIGGYGASGNGAQEDRPPVISAKPGPWGDLEYNYIYLEAPENLLALYPLPSTLPHWTFPQATFETLNEMFRRAGMPDDLRTAMLERNRVASANGALYVNPTVAELEAIPQKARPALYRELAKWPQNEYYYDPVLILLGSVEEWLRGTDVRPDVRRRIERLTYRRGDTLAFSDLEALMSYAESTAEARRLFKAITRVRTIMVRLKFDRRNLSDVVGYWSEGYRRTDIMPMLHSMSETGAPASVDLIHLLPPLPRRLLYRYPAPELATRGRMPDCHWTSLNFFNYTPENLFLDSRLMTSQILENYTRVKPPYRYGDVLLVVSKEAPREAIHSCVYIADNLVFTKNGGNLLTPWILMTLDDIASAYLKDGNTEIVPLRRKPPSTGE